MLRLFCQDIDQDLPPEVLDEAGVVDETSTA
jgi:hypothetical protein